ncbi:MAG: helix-turn-helix transcriptional regulator [Dokdonella sp.]|uniref:helix-turn-helix transcriptional regulator n=1 Tax=Dokdonella sp. TaxID=2291710 RepID=UPI0032675878
MPESHFLQMCRARELLAGELSIEQVAQRSFISRFHFIRMFRALFGTTPQRFRTRLRIEKAKWLLATTAMPVTRICCEVGFGSLGSFSDLFAKRVGVSPTRFREEAIDSDGGLSRKHFPGCLPMMAALPADALRKCREAQEIAAR